MAGEIGPHMRPVFPEGGSVDDLALARQAVDIGYDQRTLLAVGFSRLELDDIHPSDQRLEHADLFVARSFSDEQASNLWNPEDTQPIDLAALRKEIDRLYDGSALFPETGEPDFSALGHDVDTVTDRPVTSVQNYDPNDHAVGVDGTMKTVRQADTTGDYV